MKKRENKLKLFFSFAVLANITFLSILSEPITAGTVSENQIINQNNIISEITAESSYGTLVDKGNMGTYQYDPALGYGTYGKNMTWAVYNQGSSSNPDYVLVLSGYGNCYGWSTTPDVEHPENAKSDAPYWKYDQYITRAVIEEGVTDIGLNAFSALHNLKYVSFPSSLTTIRELSFVCCTGLETIVLPDTITTIKDSAFQSCTNLKQVTFSKNLKEMGFGVFMYDKSLKEVVLPDSLDTISGSCFSFCESLERVKLPSNLVSIKDSAFSMSEKLYDITIPDTVREIGPYSFQATAITSVNLPKGLTTIGEMSFNNVQLAYIEIPDTVTTIETRAFSHNHAIKTVVIPSSVTTLGDLVFRECSITDLYIPASVTSIGNDLFEYCGTVTIHGEPGSAAEAYANKDPKANFVADYDKAPKSNTQEIKKFVERLYNVCLDRSSDSDGFSYWTTGLKNQSYTGSTAAEGFIFSNEFKAHNYCNACYVEHLYNAFMGRSSDSDGKAYWISQLESGKTREFVFNGFLYSEEFKVLCSNAGIAIGEKIKEPDYGTIPKGNCSQCGEVDGVTQFTTRMYKVCLDRTPDTDGLAYWNNLLWNHTMSGTEVAFGFVFSPEFQGKKLNNEDYVEYLYKVFFDRNSDSGEKNTG